MKNKKTIVPVLYYNKAFQNAKKKVLTLGKQTSKKRKIKGV